jgi:hypothetical protein
MLAGAAVWALAGTAHADPPDRLTFHAGHVEADTALRDVTLDHDVQLAYGRYRVTSEHLHLRVDRGTVVFDGDARLALCPCADPPLTFGARGGRFEPQGDLFLIVPRIEIAKQPVFALPILWLRSPDRVGLLPPIVALRGTDGLLLGSGVHLPWRGGALDLTAGGFTAGGAEIGAALRTEETRARVTVDRINGTRVALDARGSLAESGAPAVAWDLDAVRGDRARSGTIDLAPAAQPFDTGSAEASLRAGGGGAGVIAGGGVIARAPRGEGSIVAGPRAALALGGTLGHVGSWSAGASGVVLGGADPRTALPLGRASIGGEIDARPGPFELRTSAQARAYYVGAIGGSDAPSREMSAAASAELALPFARSFASHTAGEAPLVHWITPSLLLRGALADEQGTFFQPIGGALPSASWIAAAGLSTSLGRYAGPALRLDARAGVAGEPHGILRSLLFARLGADGRLAAATVSAAAVGARIGGTPVGLADDPGARGYAVLGRTRFGPDGGPFVRVDLGAQGGGNAGEARAIAAGAWAALPGDALAYLAESGVTLGAEMAIPWTRAFRTGARIDADLAAGAVLAVRGIAEYRHPCGCLGLGLLAAHRAGREGVDVAVTVDVVPPFRGERAPPSSR